MGPIPPNEPFALDFELPEELVTQFKIEMVHFVAQAYNIDAIRPQLRTLPGIKN